MPFTFEAVEDFINCTICLNVMKNTTTTSCCHRFCENCIFEWVDRNSKCPCCNTHLTSKNLFHDCQFDCLIENILKEREKSEIDYFAQVCNERVPQREYFSNSRREVFVETNTQVQNSIQQPTVQLTTVEEVARKHLKLSLIDHGRYFQSLRDEYEKKKKFMELEIKNIEDDNHDSSRMCEADINTKVESLKNEIEKLNTEFVNCQLLVAEAYDKYLTEKIPKLNILPVSVSLYIVDKNLRIPNVVFTPERCIYEVQDLLKNIMKERHDDITVFNDKPIYIFSPLSKGKNEEFYRDIMNQIENGRDYPEVKTISWLDKPVLKYEMKPGSEIVFINCMTYESDEPPVCFVKKYREGTDQLVDYYKCLDCTFSWICKSCIKNCHDGHRTSVHVLNNKPSWACCYCPKKKKCCL